MHVKEEANPYVQVGTLRHSKEKYVTMFFTHYGYCLKSSHLKRVIINLTLLNRGLRGVSLSFPLIRDTFAILGGSQHECLSVFDIKAACHTINYERIQNHSVQYSYNLVNLVMCIKECPWIYVQVRLFDNLI